MKKSVLVILGVCLLLAGCGNAAPAKRPDGTEGKIQNGTAAVTSEAAEGNGLSGEPAVSEGAKDFMSGEGGQQNAEPTGTGQISAEQEPDVQALVAQFKDYQKYSPEREIYEKLYDLSTVVENPIHPEGTWNRTDVHSGMWGSLTISEATEGSFQVEGELGYYSHSGWFEETAYYVAEDVAIARYDDLIEGEPEYVAFWFRGDDMEVFATANSSALGFGANVAIDGTYTQGEPVYTNAAVLEESFTEQNLADLQELLPENYYTDYFLFATENGAVSRSETTLPNGYPVTCVEAFVPTMGGYAYTLYFSEDGYYDITFDYGVSFSTDPAGVAAH